MTRHYLDHASTSPLRPEARAAMVAALDLTAADPGRLHAEGLGARVALEQARQAVADWLGCRSREVVFTSGATESITAATAGAVARAVGAGHPPHVVMPAVEHSAVRLASTTRAEVSTVGVDGFGQVDVDQVSEMVRPGVTALVHVQWANHEVGTRQPVAAIAAHAREAGVLTHCDAAAAGAWALGGCWPLLGVDLLSVGAHKLGGPPGIGVLVVRRGLRLDPLLLGGAQERARRAGLENLPAAAGLAAVATLLSDERVATDERDSVAALADRVRGFAVDGLRVHGHPTDRADHIVCLGVDGVEPQAVLLGLDQAGVAVHSGSSCAAEDLEPSPVLAAMGVDAHHSLRVSLGWSSTDADVDALAGTLPAVLERLLALR